MLQKLRDKTSGWIASVIFGLLLIPFSFFGVEQYMHSKTETWSAKIEAPPTWWSGAPNWWPASLLWTREEISNQEFRQRFERERQAQRQELGAAYDPRAFETPDTKRRIIDEMIDQRVMQMAATRAGVSISDAQVQSAIAGMPVFQVDGRFNKERYQFALASQQMAPAGFEKEVRDGLQVDLLPSGLNDSSFVTKSEMDRVLKLLAEQRTVSYVQLPAPTPDMGPVKGAEIDAWYRTHHSEFRAPETVSIEYVEVDASALNVPPADEAALRARFEQEKGKLGAQGERLVSHILVAVPADASVDAQKAAEDKATKLAAEAKQPGADFAALARANSDDTGSKANGGDLGDVERGTQPKAFEDAVFAMQAGEVRGPIKTEFGWHIIQVREVKTAAAVTFEDMREKLAAEQATADRERIFNELTTKLVDLVNKNPTALAPAAKEANLPVQTLGPFPREGGTGIAGNLAVQRAAFSDSMIQDGLVSDTIEIAPDHVVMLRVTQHTPARELPVSQVRERIVAEIRGERTRKAAQATADAMVAQLKAGTPIAQAAAAKGLVAVDLPIVPRGAPLPAREATQAYFSVPSPAAGKVSPGSVRLQDGSFVVFAVTKVTEGDPSKATAQERDTLRRQLAQAGGNDDARAFVAAMRRAMKIDVAEDRL